MLKYALAQKTKGTGYMHISFKKAENTFYLCMINAQDPTKFFTLHSKGWYE